MARNHRRTGLRALAIGALVLAGGCARPAPAPAPPPAVAPAPVVTTSCAASAPDARTARVLELANAARAASGVAPLHWDGQLSCLASDWSSHMASSGSLTHQDLAAALRSPQYSGYSTLGENILRGPSQLTGDQMHNAWMASAGHQANILSASYTSFAVATTISANGTLYSAAEFGG